MSEEQRLTRRYSERLGPLTGEQLQAALDRFDLGTLQDAAPMPGGLFGQNVLVTSTRGEWVLRGCPHADWQLPKERLAARLIHERTSLAVPWPYLVEASPAVFGWSFALMPRLPGRTRGEEGGAVAAALGSGLARLHELRDEAAGDYDLAARREALAEPFEACWVHHDWKPNNVLCEGQGAELRATGVVDLMEGYFGDGEEDLVRCVGIFARAGRACIERFTRAYRARWPLRPGFGERYRIYQLIDCLVFWQFGQKNGRWFAPDLTLRAFAEPLVEGLEPF